MHNVYTRANAAFFAALCALGIMCGLTAFSTYFHHPTPLLNSLKLKNLERFYRAADGTDKAVLTFDIDADLSSVFNWNTKQLFVYVVAEYETSSNVVNQVVIWDKIVKKKKQAKLRERNQRTDYFLADQYDELRNTDIKLKLMWDIMPVSGRLFIHEKPGSHFQMPTVYNKRR